MNVTFLTEENWERSPFTGWTRERWVELAEKMIIAIQPYLTPGKGGLALPNPVRWMDAFLSDPQKMKNFYWMEGYTRTRILIASWLIGTGKTTLTINGHSTNILDQFMEGLISASDPSHPEYISDRYGNDQWIAEISAVALALYIAREIVWEKMTSKERKQVSTWMFSTTGKKIPHNNWYLFLANTNYVLKALGERYNEKELEYCIKQIKSFDLGNGWFMDGDETRGYSIDQYNAWGFHHFLPAFVDMGENDPSRKQWIIDRLSKFVVCYEKFFASNGAMPMWGRSWAYRPAVTAPFIWAEILGVSPVRSGELRRLVSGQMKYWVDHNYFQDDMTPTMGYAGENLALIEPYSQYGSPYWGNLMFLNLLLPPDHAFWTEEEQPLPVERGDYCVSEEAIGMTICGNQSAGEVQLINHRAWHQKEGPGTRYAKKYTNFSYSSHFGIDLRRNEYGYNCDSMISISPDGKRYSQRIIPNFIRVENGYGASFHYPMAGFPFIEEEDSRTFAADSRIEMVEDRSVKITTQTHIKDFCQIRLHTIETEQGLKAVKEGGFALNYSGDVPQIILDEKSIGVFNDRRGCFIQAVLGFDGPEDVEQLLIRRENHNTLGGWSITPTLVAGKLLPGKHIFASLSGTWLGKREDHRDKLNLIQNIEVTWNQVVVEFHDGTDWIFNV